MCVINRLYKFLPARPSFFENLLLRASSKHSLNDPFEAKPSASFWADLFTYTKNDRFGGTKEEIIKYLQKQPPYSRWSELGVSLFYEYGIISLTETKDNLLMWSHYADQHRGMVIEFDVSHPFFCSTHSENALTGNTRRVLYRKERLNELGDYLLEPYFHKSDEWAYEKEHRLLLKLDKADSFLVPYVLKEKLLDEKILQEHDFKEFLPDEFYELSGCAYCYEEPNYMAMYRVAAEAVVSVSFGCKSESSFIQGVLNELGKENLKHVEVYHASIDHHDYRVRFTPSVYT
jgi:hypothetical protein